MTATQMIGGHGGWPNSVFLTPELEPFFAGTYFPPEDRHGQPAFRRVLESLAAAWKDRRDDVMEQAAGVAGAMRQHLGRRSAPAPEAPSAGTVRRTVDALERHFDRANGGFGGAPKFPMPANLFLLLEAGEEGGREHEMLDATLDAMARGGIFDQLGGGFHRYATDAEWNIPHFEKMLYDNGLLLEIYARRWAGTRDPEMERVVRSTVGFLEREMRDEEGFFWSALDAETDGEEGAYYVWEPTELHEVLGEENFHFAAPLLGFDGPPFFEGHAYVLHLPRPRASQAEIRRASLAELREQLDPLRERLLARRWERPRIATDDKVLADWNGMAIAGLATAGGALGDPAVLASAGRAADAVLRHLRAPEGTLRHAWRAGEAKVDALLADYAFMVRGLLALDEHDADDRWLEAAAELTTEQVERLGDPLGGFFNSAERSDLLVRSKGVVDGAVPAANSIAVLNLQTLAERTGERRWADLAAAALRAFATQIEQTPDGARTMSVAVLRHGKDETAATVTRSVDRESSPGAPETPMQARAASAVRPHLELSRPDTDGWRAFRLLLEIEPGLHLQANPASADYLVPTEVSSSRAEVRDVVYPPGSDLPSDFAGEPISVYSGRVELTGAVRGDGLLHLTYQACSDAGCLPLVRVDLPLSAGRDADA